MTLHEPVTMTGLPLVKYSFRGNSVFDPDFSGGGFQPNMYDDMTALYGEYTVIACKINVQAQNNGNVPSVLSIERSMSSTPLTLNSVTYDPFDTVGVKSKLLNSYLLGTNNGVVNMKRTSTTSAAFNVPDIVSPETYSAANANPTNIWYWHISVGNATDPLTGTNVNVQLQVFLTYYVLWRRVKPQTMD